MNPPPSPSPGIKPARLSSIDAYRGLVMLLMLGEGLRFCSVARALPESGFWKFLCHHQSHVPWAGGSLHDLIQPSFSFLVGVALPFSLGSRTSQGAPFFRIFGHALWRSLLLIALGIGLRSIGHAGTNFTFEDTLTQIGLGYAFLFVLGWCPVKVQWSALGLILAGYWLAFALHPLPGPDFNWSAAGVAKDWEHNLSGFAVHWNKNTNFAWAFDQWFMNLFPRQKPFQYNSGGYSTLSFIPTLGTMILGLIAGGWLKSGLAPAGKLKRFVIAGAVGLAGGLLLDATGICPNVKCIWTPAWVLFSGGWCFLFLAFFHAVLDVGKFKAWAFPLVVIGANSIFAYCSEWLFVGFIHGTLNTHLGGDFFKRFGPAYTELFRGACVLLVIWLMLLWLYRKKVFIKI